MDPIPETQIVGYNDNGDTIHNIEIDNTGHIIVQIDLIVMKQNKESYTVSSFIGKSVISLKHSMEKERKINDTPTANIYEGVHKVNLLKWGCIK